MLGLVETPLNNTKRKLKVSKASELHVAEWSPSPAQAEHVWTDGPVQLTTHPWLTLASYAVVVVSAAGTVLGAGRVFHWRRSSCSAELWAVIAAFAATDKPLIVHTCIAEACLS